MKLSATDRSEDQYSWNHFGVSPSSSATSSIVSEATEESIIGTPASRAPAAVASSAPSWAMDWMPMGASMTGTGSSCPQTSTERSRSLTSRRNRGTIRQRSNARRLRPTVFSPPAPPAT